MNLSSRAQFAPLVIGVVLLFTGLAWAGLIEAAPADFAAKDALIEFEDIAQAECTDTAYISLEATSADGFFTSALPGHVGAFAESGNFIAINFDPLLISTGSPMGFDFSINVRFEVPMTRFHHLN